MIHQGGYGGGGGGFWSGMMLGNMMHQPSVVVANPGVVAADGTGGVIAAPVVVQSGFNWGGLFLFIFVCLVIVGVVIWASEVCDG